MMGLIVNDEDVCRVCSVKPERDADNPLNLDGVAVPGGGHLRMPVIGDCVCLRPDLNSIRDPVREGRL